MLGKGEKRLGRMDSSPVSVNGNLCESLSRSALNQTHPHISRLT